MSVSCTPCGERHLSVCWLNWDEKPHTLRIFVGVWCGKRLPWNFLSGRFQEILISQLEPPTIFLDYLNVLGCVSPTKLDRSATRVLSGHEELLHDYWVRS